MSDLLDSVRKSPALARSVPFVVFLVFTAFQGDFGESGRYWIYLAKTVVGAWMVWELRGVVAEMRWAFSWEAVAVGVLVFVLWVGLDPYYPGQDRLMFQMGFGKDPAKTPVKIWNPFEHFGEASLLGWCFVVVRTLGSTLVVPALEEVFYRSFLYRYLISPEFERIPLSRVHGVSVVITCFVFAFTHQQWLAAVLCGLLYQGLVFRKQRLGDAMTAHAITNFLLAVYVVARPAWQFW